MDLYEKLSILASLNEDLKEFNEDYKITKKLIEENQKTLLQNEKAIENYSEKVNQKLWEEFTRECEEDEEKAQLTYSRWLSDWSLECEFRSPDGSTFTKVYTEDNIFCQRSMRYEEEEKKENEVFQQALNKFWWLMFTYAHPQRLEKFKALL